MSQEANLSRKSIAAVSTEWSSPVSEERELSTMMSSNAHDALGWSMSTGAPSKLVTPQGSSSQLESQVDDFMLWQQLGQLLCFSCSIE